MLARDQIKDIYPLTPFQEGIYFHDLIDREGGAEGPRAYFQQQVLRLRGRLDGVALEAAWQCLVERHDILRTLFRSAAERPLQLVLKQRGFALERIDLRHLPETERGPAVARYVAEQRATPFDLGRDSLMRVGLLQLAAEEHALVWSFHHILVDGSCISLLQDELSTAYRAYAAGRIPALPQVPQFGEFVQWSEARRALLDEAFWSRYLAGCRPSAPLPGARPAALPGAREARLEVVEFGAELTARLGRLAAAQRITLNMLVQGLWGLLLGRLSGEYDVLFGAVVSTRPAELAGAERMLGPCIATLPFRVRFSAEERVDEFLQRIGRESLEWLAHRYSSPAEAQANARAAGGRQGLFNYFVDYTNFPTESRHTGETQELDEGLQVTAVEPFIQHHYDFHMLAIPGDSLRLELHYNHRVVDGEAVADLARRAVWLAERMVEGPHRPLAEVPLFAPGERARIVDGWCRGAPSRPPAATLRELLARNAAADPQRPALHDGERLFRHGELWARAGTLALDLHRRWGVSAEGAVALALPTGEPLVRGMLACMALGVPFVPLDPQAPAARNRHILEDCTPALVITDGGWEGALPEGPTLVLEVEPTVEAFAGIEALPPTAAGAAAYIIYTSGSTGAPKGVRVGQASLLNYLGWLSRDLGIGAADHGALLTSPAFDLGYTALFGALLLGGTLTLADEERRRDPEWVVGMVAERGVSFLKMTPSYLTALLDSPAAAALSTASALRLLLLGGEPQVFGDLVRLKALCPQLSLVNHYGPTEGTIGCVAGALDDLVERGEPLQRIGRPIAGAAVMVCDGALEPLPPWVEGELVIGGAAPALGYLRPEPEEGARFVHSAVLGGRAYRTGDYGYWRGDGSIVFTGRRDDQVKVRGHRVTLGGVEEALRGCRGVADAAVVVDRSRIAAGELVAFLIPQEGAALDPAGLRRELAERVPEAMIPSHSLLVSRFPLTANGKLDRAALRPRAGRIPLRGAADSGPGNATEEALRAIWRDVLFLEQVGLEDDFFALGGHSIKAITVVSRVRASMQRTVGIRDLFDHPTIRALAARLDGADPAAGAQEPLIRLREGKGSGALFFPPLLGTSTVYKELVDALSVPFRCRGFQHPGFDRDEPFAENIAALAERYRRRIVEADGVTLVGWSMGAHVALEVAKGLEAAGASVRLLLLDAAPRVNGSVESVGEPRVTRFEELRRQPYWGRVLGTLTEQLDAAEVARIERLMLHNQSLLDGYRFEGRLRGDITCIEAGGNPRPTGMARFAACTSGRVTTYRVGGDHYSMFHPPHLYEVQRLFEAALVGAGG
ncbi:non-ribosomal peptide synthetase [Endothiovibrio diazotrophicus]